MAKSTPAPPHPIGIGHGFYQLTAQLAMVGKKLPLTMSDPAFLSLPSGSDPPSTLRWASLASVSEEKWDLLPSGKATFAFPLGLLTIWSSELGSASLCHPPDLFISFGKPTQIWPVNIYKKIHSFVIHGDFWLWVRVWEASSKNEAWDYVLEKKTRYWIAVH